MTNTSYYIDEAGSIDSNSDFFVLGCYKTDTPEDLRSGIERLRQEILEDAYFAFQRERFVRDGFHACDNHFDIRARFYAHIATINIRAYVLLVKKESTYFKSLLSDELTSKDIYNLCIKKLLTDRLTKTRYDHNILIFEQYGNKPNNWKKNLQSVIEEIKTEIKNLHQVNLSYEIEVHDKSDINLSVIDYINFLFVQFYEHRKNEPRMVENFKIIEPKIGVVLKMDQGRFYDKNKRLDVSRY